MLLADAIQHYGSQAAIARALGIHQSAVAQWAMAKRIPLLRQHQIERLTGGALKADDPVTESTRRRVRRHRAGLNGANPELAAQAEGGTLALPGEG